MRFIYYFGFSLAASVHCFQSHHQISSVQLLKVKSTLELRSRDRKRSLFLLEGVGVGTKSHTTSSLNSSQASPDIEELYRKAMEEDKEWFHTYIAPKLDKDKYGEENRKTTTNDDDSRVMENDDTVSFRDPEEGEKDSGDDTMNVMARARQPKLSAEVRMEESERKASRARLMNDTTKDPIYTDEPQNKSRQQQEILRPTRRRRRLDSEDVGVVDQENHPKGKRRDPNTNSSIDQQQRYRRTEKKPADGELTGTRFWPGLRPFKDALKSELYLRASILDLFGGRFRKLKQPLKMEGKMRYQLYSSWLKLLKNGVGEPILDLDYEKDRMPRDSIAKNRNYGEQIIRRRKRRNSMGEEEFNSFDAREGLRKPTGRNPGDIASGGSRRSLSRGRDLEYLRFRDDVDDK